MLSPMFIHLYSLYYRDFLFSRASSP
jgi:hypothetical protein